jgi:hypothetical protein
MFRQVLDDTKETRKQILEKVEETQLSVSQLDKKMDLHIQKTGLELEQIKVLDEKQNQLLADHAARSDRLEKDNQLREQALKIYIDEKHDTLETSFTDKIQVIEKPRQWLIMTSKIFFWCASAAGALYGVWQFIETILK